MSRKLTFTFMRDRVIKHRGDAPDCEFLVKWVINHGDLSKRDRLDHHVEAIKAFGYDVEIIDLNHRLEKGE